MFLLRRPFQVAWQRWMCGWPSPHAARAGGDCTEGMVITKHNTYATHRNELDAEGITYVPVVWSAYGRPHPDAVRILVTLARCTARRRGTSDAFTLARRTAARIAAAIWRRAARMVLACWPESAGFPSDGTPGPPPPP